MGLFDGLFSRHPSPTPPAMATATDAAASPSPPSSSTSLNDPPLSPAAISLVHRCARIAGVPAEQLLRWRLEPGPAPEAEEPVALARGRSLVEYCSYMALRAETRRRQHDDLLVGDAGFHSLTYDMMLAWEAPDPDTDADLQKSVLLCSGDVDGGDDGTSMFYSSPTQMAIQVDGRRTVGPEAFAKIAPACPAVAHPMTVRNLFDVLTNSTGGRLHFLIYHKYLKSLDTVLQSTKLMSGGVQKTPRLELCNGEVVLDVFGAATTKPVLQHIGTSTWPG